MMEDVVEALRQQFGEAWAQNDEENLRFSVDVEHLLREVDGAHLMGDPDVEDGRVTLRVWVDFPLRDLMSADQLAYEIFGKVSEEFFCAERRFAGAELRYPFVTGSPRHGHIGTLVLSGPHAAAFAERFQQRVVGGARYHA